jgi:D-alanyl-D-alanine-carboxypeptidase/D-alanyl-D-alanine-endopeptidase
MNRQAYIRCAKLLAVLSVIVLAGLQLGRWNIGSSPTPRDDKIPARAPIALTNLQQALDVEFAPILRDGLLKEATGCGIAIGIVDHSERRVFTYGAAHADSIFEIGSITKTFTGLALAQLAAQGKVRLDEPVRVLVPFDIAPNIAPGPVGAEITLLDLVTHRSGLPSVPDNLKPKDPDNPFAEYDRVALHEFLLSHGTARPADAKYLYSSFGIGLLGYALAARAGIPYAELVRNEITGPLHMNDTVFAVSPVQKWRVIQGHGPALDPVEAELGESGIFTGAVGAKSTVEDLLIYADANLHPERYAAGARVGTPGATLPAAFLLDHQLRGVVQDNTEVAFSWLYDVPSGRFEHGGSTPGYTAHVEFAPEQDRAIVVLYNRMDERPGQERFVDRVAENINELMSGKPSARLDFIAEGDPALVALEQIDDNQ